MLVGVDLKQHGDLALTLLGDHPRSRLVAHGPLDLNCNAGYFGIEWGNFFEAKLVDDVVLEFGADRRAFVRVNLWIQQVESPRTGAVQDVLHGIIDGRLQEIGDRLRYQPRVDRLELGVVAWIGYRVGWKVSALARVRLADRSGLCR